MKKLITIAAIAGTLLLTACQSNVVTAAKGFYGTAGINPATYTAGISFGYGDVVNAVVGENSEVVYKTEVTAEGDSNEAEKKNSKAGTISKTQLTVKTGTQNWDKKEEPAK